MIFNFKFKLKKDNVQKIFIIKSLYFDSVCGIFIAYLFYCIKMPNKRSRRDKYI